MYNGIVEAIPVLLDNLFTVQMGIALLIGIVGGLIMGALPGINAVIGMSLLLPITYSMDPIPAIAMLMSIYTTTILGGSFTAILVNTPGTGSNVVTTLDGYQMTRRGQAMRALSTALYASVFGGVFSALMMLLLSPPLARFSLKFDSAETFLLGILGISIIASLSSSGLKKGMLAGCLGMLLCTVGFTPGTYVNRFTFGNIYLNDGFNETVVILGLFSIAQVLRICIEIHKGQEITKMEVAELKGKWLLPWTDFKKCIAPAVRGVLIGIWVGLLPGAGPNISAFIAYNDAKKHSKHPEEFGKGAIEGVAAPEAANNATTGAAMIPLFTLGIPGSAAAAVLLGGLMIQGLIPGASMFTKQSGITYSVIILFLFANIIMLPAGIFFTHFFKKILSVPPAVLNTIIAVLVVLGSFSIQNRAFDMSVLIIFGILGFLMNMAAYPESAFILGILLGGLTEDGFIRTITICEALEVNPLFYFMGRPLCLVLFALIIFGTFGPSIIKAVKKYSKRGAV
ncbi:MAG: tripartite tricarboxylate transporter permease [Christensenellales bacterium]|jgi:putative tricarboxylic transport membrane protein